MITIVLLTFGVFLIAIAFLEWPFADSSLLYTCSFCFQRDSRLRIRIRPRSRALPRFPENCIMPILRFSLPTFSFFLFLATCACQALVIHFILGEQAGFRLLAIISQSPISDLIKAMQSVAVGLSSKCQGQCPQCHCDDLPIDDHHSLGTTSHD